MPYVQMKMNLERCLILVIFIYLSKSFSSLVLKPDQFQFDGNDAFIELDTYPLSCSVNVQSAFSISFDVKVNANSTVIFAGISGNYKPEYTSQTAPPKSNQNDYISGHLGTEGDSLALILYLDRPYIRLVVLRLTDNTFRFYRHHATGLFDRHWVNWHRVSIETGRQIGNSQNKKSRMELIFSFNKKTANNFLQPLDLLWPSWSNLKNEAIKYMLNGTLAQTSSLIMHSNEFFFGMPPIGTMSRYAVDYLFRHHRVLRNKVSFNTDKTKETLDENESTFLAFHGAIKNILLSSACECGNSKFGPRFISKGYGVKINSICDVDSLPLTENFENDFSKSVCHAKGNYSQPCGCLPTKCYCPDTSNCSKKIENISFRMAFLTKDLSQEESNNDIKINTLNSRHENDYEESYNGSFNRDFIIVFESKKYLTYRDTCFSNIFTCKEDIIYRFWLFVDPVSILKSNNSCTTQNSIVLMHASSPNSPWFFRLKYNYMHANLPFRLVTEIHSLSGFHWIIDECENDEGNGSQFLPGRWQQVTVEWNTTHLSMSIDGRICATTVKSKKMPYASNPTDQFWPRNTAFLFARRHDGACSPGSIIHDFTFNVRQPMIQSMFPKFHPFVRTYSAPVIDSILNPAFNHNVFNVTGDVYYINFDVPAMLDLKNISLFYFGIPSLGIKLSLKKNSSFSSILELTYKVQCLRVETHFPIPQTCFDRNCFIEIQHLSSGTFQVFYRNKLVKPIQSLEIPNQCSKLDICADLPIKTLMNKQQQIMTYCARHRFLLQQHIRFFSLDREQLKNLNLIQTDNFPRLQCHFDGLKPTTKILKFNDLCRPSKNFSSIVPTLIKFNSQSSEGFAESPIDGSFVISNKTNPILHLSPTQISANPAEQCFQGLEFCPFGVTVAFWLAFLPELRSSFGEQYQNWRVFDLLGVSNSRMVGTVERLDGDQPTFALNVMVKMLLSNSPAGRLYTIWKIRVNWSLLKDIWNRWALIDLSWSEENGLSVSINHRHPIYGQKKNAFEAEDVEEPHGMLIGGSIRLINEEIINFGTLIIDELNFIPAERNNLLLVEQYLEFNIDNASWVPPCDVTTCLENLFCKPSNNNLLKMNPNNKLCRCVYPNRVCGKVNELMRNIAVTDSVATTSLVNLTTITYTTKQKPKMNHQIEPIIKNESDENVKMKTVSKPLTCDPTCLNEGVCQLQEIQQLLICNCSKTLSWGLNCQHEFVGWFNEEPSRKNTSSNKDFTSKIKKNAYFELKTSRSNIEIRLLFRSPVNLNNSKVEYIRRKRNLIEKDDLDMMILVSFKGKNNEACGIGLNDEWLTLVCRDNMSVSKLTQQLKSCSGLLNPFNGQPHFVEVKFSSNNRLRIWMDAQPIYPKDLHEKLCLRDYDGYSEDSLFFHLNEYQIAVSKINIEKNLNRETSGNRFQRVVLGSWPNGRNSFLGVIGGFQVNKKLLILPQFNESYNGSSKLYRLSSDFKLSTRNLTWLHMNSLTPATVLYDDDEIDIEIVNDEEDNEFSYKAISICILMFIIISLIILGVRSYLRCYRSRHVSSNNFRTTNGGVEKMDGWCQKYSRLKRNITYTVIKKTSKDVTASLQMSPLLVAKIQTEGVGTLSKSGDNDTKPVKPLKPPKSFLQTRILTLKTTQRNAASEIDTLPFFVNDLKTSDYSNESDDIEKIMVTSCGQSVVTLSTNRGFSIKIWNTQDGDCRKHLKFQHISSPSVSSGYLALHPQRGFLLGGQSNSAQLWDLKSDEENAISTFTMKTSIWDILPFANLFLIIAAPTSGNGEKGQIATLHIWCPELFVFILQTSLKVKKTTSLPTFYSRRQPALLSADLSRLICRWITTSKEDSSRVYAHCVTVCLKNVVNELTNGIKTKILSRVLIPTTLIEHSIDLELTDFLTDDFVVTGDKQGIIHVWNLTNGHIIRSVKNDPMPADGPLFPDLNNPDLFSSLLQNVDCSWAKGPITALATTSSTTFDTSQFNWLCSGDSSGCVVVRRCFTANTSRNNSSSIAVRIHAKFRPFSKSALVYSHDAVTCLRLLDTGILASKLPETLLATGDSVGCIRTWLLPQCTQLTQLSASCESSLVDLVMSHPLTPTSSRGLEKSQSVQIIGLVRARTEDEASCEHGRVVIVHLSATGDTSILNAMHSPRFRRITKLTHSTDNPV